MSKPIPLNDLGKAVVSCTQCGVFDLCFVHELVELRRNEVEAIVRRQRQLGREAHMFHAGQSLKSVCVVQSGTVKTYQLSSEGEEIVTGFHLPGELIGLDAIGRDRHPEFAVALEDSRYCDIPFREFQKILDDSPELNKLMLKMLSIDMMESREMLLVIGRMDARARVAIFLLNLSSRLNHRGEDGSRFRLSMDRRDLANFLGLTIETVSRTLSWMQKEDMLKVRGKLVQLLDCTALLETAGREHEQLLDYGQQTA